MGIYRGYVRIIGICWGNGQENGNYNLGFGVRILP